MTISSVSMMSPTQVVNKPLRPPADAMVCGTEALSFDREHGSHTVTVDHGLDRTPHGVVACTRDAAVGFNVSCSVGSCGPEAFTLTGIVTRAFEGTADIVWIAFL